VGGICTTLVSPTQTLQSNADSPPFSPGCAQAPELLEGHPASVQSDIYALGLIMAELLNWQLPFTEERRAGATPFRVSRRSGLGLLSWHEARRLLCCWQCSQLRFSAPNSALALTPWPHCVACTPADCQPHPPRCAPGGAAARLPARAAPVE